MDFYYLGPAATTGHGASDPLLTTAPGIFIVSASLRQAIEAIQLTGVAFPLLEIAAVDIEPAGFVSVHVTGKIGRDDFGYTEKTGLVVSERALDMLELAGLAHADIVTFTLDVIDEKLN